MSVKKKQAKLHSKICANPKCKKPFTTRDVRQRFHNKKCGQRVRSRRWMVRATKAMKMMRRSTQESKKLKESAAAAS